MRRAGLVLLVLAAGCTKSPAEEAGHHGVRITDFFNSQGGVLITESHVLTMTSIVEAIEKVYVIDSAKEKAEAKVLKRDSDHGVSLLYVKNKKASGAKLGEAALLEDGAALTALLYGGTKDSELKTGVYQGWRYSEGLAYLQTDLDVMKSDLGAGVFGPTGKLIGLVAFTKGPRITYVLPIEYISNGDRALTAHPETRRAIGTHRDSDEFAEIRAEGIKHPDPLVTPIKFETILTEHTFSNTAMVGVLTLLEKKESPAHAQPISFKVEAVNAERQRRVIGEGQLGKGHFRFNSDKDIAQATKASLLASYGQEYLDQHFDPYQYGLLAFRVPFAGFCKEVTDTEVHALTLTLADGRKSGEMAYNDMVNLCQGTETGEGNNLEEAWELTVEATASAADEPVGPTKAKRKRRGKKKRRRRRR